MNNAISYKLPTITFAEHKQNCAAMAALSILSFSVYLRLMHASVCFLASVSMTVFFISLSISIISKTITTMKLIIKAGMYPFKPPIHNKLTQINQIYPIIYCLKCLIQLMLLPRSISRFSNYRDRCFNWSRA